MPRRPRRPPRGPARPVADAPLRGGWQRVEPGEGPGDGDWIVRSVSGAAAEKVYRCPGCDQEIPAGTPHVVAWPADDGGAGGWAVQERRHWHTRCWRSAQGRRGR